MSQVLPWDTGKPDRDDEPDRQGSQSSRKDKQL